MTKKNDAAAALIAALRVKKKTLAGAESSTGGLVGAMLTAIPGASECFLGGVISYTNDVKHRLLGVKNETLSAYTAVSAETAAEMAAGARALIGSDLAYSVTGYAGPGAGADGTPAGTVFIGIADARGATAVGFHFAGGRNEVRAAAAEQVCAMLNNIMKETNG